MSGIGVVLENPSGPGYSLLVGGKTYYSEKELDSTNKLYNLLHSTEKTASGAMKLRWDLHALWIIGTRTASYPLAPSALVDARTTSNASGQIQAMKLWHISTTFTASKFVFFATVDTRWNIPLNVAPAELAAAVVAVESELKMHLEWSPGHSGQNIMKELDGSRNWFSYADLSPMPIRGNMPHGLQRKHPLENINQDAWLHIYDKTFDYGGVCKGVHLGEGNPEFYHASTGMPEFREGYPGIWRLPTGKWAWTPRVQLYIRQELIKSEDLIEAWIWTRDTDEKPRYHQTLRPWAQIFWSMDQKFRANHMELARTIGKSIRTQALGWLAHESDYTTSSNFARPDIWAMIVETSACAAEHKSQELWDKYHIDVVWFNIDEIGILSNEADPRVFWQNGQMLTHPILAREHELGGYSHRYSVYVDSEVVAAFSDGVKFGSTHTLLLSKWRKGVPIYG